MTDETQLIDDALAVLREIRQTYRDAPIAGLAAQLAQQIRPTMTFDSALEERQRLYERTPKEFVDEAAGELSKRGPNYKTSVFKCLEDFEKCKEHSSSPRLCRAALAICMGKHLLPFVKHERTD